MESIEYRLEELKNERIDLLKDLRDAYIEFDPNAEDHYSIQNVTERLENGYMNAKDEEILLELLTRFKKVVDIDREIRNLEEHKTYEEQVDACYESFITTQERERMMDDGDKSAKMFETWIPEEVETGIVPDENEIENEHHGIKLVELKGKPIGRQYRLPLVKSVASYKTVPLEQDIQRACNQRAAEESMQQDRYRL